MRGCNADVIGLDWAVDMAIARHTLGPQRTVQVCSLASKPVSPSPAIHSSALDAMEMQFL